LSPSTVEQLHERFERLDLEVRAHGEHLSLMRGKLSVLIATNGALLALVSWVAFHIQVGG